MKLLEFFQEDNGGLSYTRLSSFIILCCLVTDWMHAVFTTGRFSPDMALVSLVITSYTAKVVQKFAEQKSTDVIAK
mgnify:CR=1 FL=1